MQNQESNKNNKPSQNVNFDATNKPIQTGSQVSYTSALKNSLHAPGGIELPKGGGAIRGIGEKAEVNPVNGSGSVSIPLPLTPGRSGFSPQLVLSYSTGAGNSEFGLGWNVGLPEITRKTDKELPLYHDLENSDTFILSGDEDLVPVCASNDDIIDTLVGGNKIRTYMPRTEGLNAKIERITKPDGYVYWRVTSKDNIVSLYGFSASARVGDPENDKRIFSWKLEYTMDSLGNFAKYSYANDSSPDYASSYLSTVEYGNDTPVTDIEATYTGGFYFSLGFVYDTNRNDAFSVFRPGFEVRNTCLCSRIEMHHNIGTLQQKVKQLSLTYDDATGLNLLTSALLTGYDAAETPVSLQSIEFSYSQPGVPARSKALDSKDLENMPGGLGDGVSFADLWGEGISGVLVKSTKAWYYKPNLGNRQWFDSGANDEIDLGKAFVLKELPSLAMENPQAAQLTDIDGDGLNEIQVMAGSIKGFHSFDESGRLSPFVPFKQMPNIDLNDPNLKMLDLNGDGYPDLLMSDENCFLVSYSKHKEGYGNLQRISKAIDEEKGPRVIFSEQQQTIFLADMSGDGLTDIVRIKNGSICYWPNLGYGKFGKKVHMRKAPRFDHSDMFDPSRIRLADVDGSGNTDIIYLGVNQTNYWKNLSGNLWSEAILIPTFPKMGALTNVSVFDIEGNGTSALVWSTPLPGKPDRIKYIELTNGKKPFLLTQVPNNTGATRSLFYAPSTKFYLQDKRAGKPWITKLGFPVHVVERIEVFDEPTQSRFVSRYAYHHGYFDGHEREFRGFGMVEQWDAEDYGTQGGGVNLQEGDTYPMYTKTWFHTGFYKNAETISDLYKQEYFDAATNAWLLPDTILPENLSIQEKREAARVLRGSPLRQEIYAQDGSEVENIPYTITENSFKITVKQRQYNNKHAVFMVLPSESISMNYERVLADPRIVHTLNLEYDEFGNPLKQATVAYQRLVNAVTGQDKTLVSVKENSFFNSDENTGFHRIGVPYQTINYEVFDFETSNAKLSIADFSDFEGLDKELIQHQKTLFYDSTCENPLSLGGISAHGLPYKSFTLAMTDALVTQHVVAEGRSNAPTAAELKTMLTDAGYVAANNDTEFWMPSESAEFDTANFYLPVSKLDPMGNQTQLTYDAYKLLPVEVADALSYDTLIENDYVNMQPVKITDPNGNGIEMTLNGLGMPLKQWLFGSQGEGDTSGSPTLAYEYALDNWTANNEPMFVHVSAKTEHGAACESFLHAYEYTGGLGQSILVKTTAEDGPAVQLDESGEPQTVQNCTTRFVATGRIVYNNKGKVIRQYEPWFSTNSGYEAEDELMEYGVTPVMHYDPAGRLIQTDFPDGTTSKVEFNAWEQKNYDQNDCDSNSDNYNTPQRVYISPLGVAFKTEDDNRANSTETIATGNTVTTIQTHDILGQVTVVEDALERSMTENVYDMAGQLIMTENIDSGKRWIIYNAAKLPICTWDRRDQRITTQYDELLRPTKTLLKVGTATEVKVQEIMYGTNAALNNIGQVASINAQDGKTNFYLYDFKYNLLSLKKKFAVDYQNLLDYNGTVSLQTEEFVTETSYDALNRPVTIIHPDSTVITNVYNKGGLLEQVLNCEDEYISSIEYNARGQRTEVIYGNNSKTRYTYDDENFRLVNLLTTRNNGADKLQDLTYLYDAVGNIVQITNATEDEHYFNNTMVSATSTYTYDALYRLSEATGRELASLQLPTHTDFANNIPVPNTDTNAMQNYTQLFTYDKLGNILQMRSVNQWTRDYFYDTATNRLLKHDEQGQPVYTYDAHGNMLTMPHLTSIGWSYKDELISAGNGTVTSFYSYDAQGTRSRKVVEKPNGIREERYYVGGFEVYRKYISSTLDKERETIHVADGRDRFVIIDTLTVENGVTLGTPVETMRYQYSNHLGSACLELDASAAIISYEEYHPFGTTSYRAGSSEAEVSLKRYKYVGKERDEETGLYYYGARYYAGWLCRFVSVDPLNEKYPELSAYQYASNRPITMIDLDGLEGTYFSKFFNQINYQKSVIEQDKSNYSASNSTKSPFKNTPKENSNQNVTSITNKPIISNASNNIALDYKIDFTILKASTEGPRLTLLDPNPKEGSTYSIGAGFAFGGGYQLELGIVEDSYGRTRFFFSHGPTIGFGIGLTFSEFDINTKNGGKFKYQMLEGLETGYDAGVGILGYHYSGNINKDMPNKEKFYKMGKDYDVNGGVLNKGAKGVNVGIMWSQQETIILDW